MIEYIETIMFLYCGNYYEVDRCTFKTTESGRVMVCVDDEMVYMDDVTVLVEMDETTLEYMGSNYHGDMVKFECEYGNVDMLVKSYSYKRHGWSYDIYVADVLECFYKDRSGFTTNKVVLTDWAARTLYEFLNKDE